MVGTSIKTRRTERAGSGSRHDFRICGVLSDLKHAKPQGQSKPNWATSCNSERSCLTSPSKAPHPSQFRVLLLFGMSISDALAIPAGDSWYDDLRVKKDRLRGTS